MGLRTLQYAQMPLLILVFILVPILELWVILQVGQAIGTLPTLVLLITMSILGAWLLRHQGRGAWRAFNATLAEGRVPARETGDGALIILGGALLLTPGFCTDAIGLLLMLPPTRAIVRRIAFRRGVTVGAAAFGPAGPWTVRGAQWGARRPARDASGAMVVRPATTSTGPRPRSGTSAATARLCRERDCGPRRAAARTERRLLRRADDLLRRPRGRRKRHGAPRTQRRCRRERAGGPVRRSRRRRDRGGERCAASRTRRHGTRWRRRASTSRRSSRCDRGGCRSQARARASTWRSKRWRAAFALSDDEPVARLGGMGGFEQPLLVTGSAEVGGRRASIDGLGQRGRSWGEPDWRRIDRTRSARRVVRRDGALRRRDRPRRQRRPRP